MTQDMWKYALMPLFAGTVILAASAASAQVAGDPDRGRETSQRICASCHNTAESAPLNPLDPAPAFAAISALPSTTSISLRVLLQTPHQRMPSNAVASGEINDIVAYILSLRR